MPTVFTFFLVDSLLKVKVDCRDDNIGQNIETTNTQKYLRIFKRNLLRYLHHAKYDDQVGAVKRMIISILSGSEAKTLQLCEIRQDNPHLWIQPERHGYRC